jgi:UDPglucose 6-dehydrogenase
MQISVIGLGKVGITLASCLGAAGNRVIGVDLDENLVSQINEGRFRSCEPGVMERLAQAGPEAFQATTETAHAIRGTDLSFVIVPTPSNMLGGFSLRYVLQACAEIGNALRTKTAPHTVAIVSTMLPGSSDCRVIRRLEQASGRDIGDNLGYCYNPSFIALGDIVKGIEFPDYVLIGEADKTSGDTVLEAHRSMMRNGSPIARMSPVEAEITKIASNTHETMRVSFANMLFSVCSEVPGANVDRITEALAHRMGRRFFKGAVPYGGPCWPRDNVAFSVFMEAIRAPSRMPRSVDLFNEEHGRYVLRRILSLTKPGETVGILGLAYKPGTPSIERSFGMDLCTWLAKEGRCVIGWDPLAIPEAGREMKERMTFASSAEDCLSRSELAVIVNPLKEFETVDWSRAGETTVVDCWRCLSPEAIRRVGRYFRLGQGPDGHVADWLRDSVGDYFDLLTN